MTKSMFEDAERERFTSRPPAWPRRVRTTDPSTSKAAAASLPEGRIRHSQEQVLAVLRRGPATDSELVVALAGEQSPSGVRTRRKELVEKGLVRDSGDRVRLPSGRQSIVWVAA